jgi:hypothetical protein
MKYGNRYSTSLQLDVLGDLPARQTLRPALNLPPSQLHMAASAIAKFHASRLQQKSTILQHGQRKSGE